MIVMIASCDADVSGEFGVREHACARGRAAWGRAGVCFAVRIRDAVQEAGVLLKVRSEHLEPSKSLQIHNTGNKTALALVLVFLVNQELPACGRSGENIRSWGMGGGSYEILPKS